MQRTDALIAATGTVVLVLAIAGSFFYASEDAIATFGVRYSTTELDLATADSSAPAADVPGVGGRTRADLAVSVATPNLTALRFHLEIEQPTAFAGQAEFGYVVTNPSGAVAAEGEFPTLSTQPKVTADGEVRLGEAPPARSVEADSERGALTRALEDTAYRGFGNWTVTIEGEWSGAGTGDFPIHLHLTGIAYHAEIGREPGAPR